MMMMMIMILLLLLLCVKKVKWLPHSGECSLCSLHTFLTHPLKRHTLQSGLDSGALAWTQWLCGLDSGALAWTQWLCDCQFAALFWVFLCVCVFRQATHSASWNYRLRHPSGP